MKALVVVSRFNADYGLSVRTSRRTPRGHRAGQGTGFTENLLRVLRILGIMDEVVNSADPYETDVGRLRMDETLPRRVRPSCGWRPRPMLPGPVSVNLDRLPLGLLGVTELTAGIRF
jgi:hypothetical protein